MRMVVYAIFCWFAVLICMALVLDNRETTQAAEQSTIEIVGHEVRATRPFRPQAPKHLRKKYPEIFSADVVYFEAKWCPYCPMQKAQVKALKERGYKVVVVDFDVCRDLADHFPVKAVPATVFLKNGRGVWRVYGEASTDELERTLRFLHPKKWRRL